jgi:hypothetical protein
MDGAITALCRDAHRAQGVLSQDELLTLAASLTD